MGEPYDFNSGFNKDDNQNGKSNQEYGNQYKDESGYSYSTKYGYGNQYAQGGQPYAYQAVMQGTRGFSVASLVLGIISIVCCCAWYVGLILGILAIVFSVVSRKKNGYFDGLAIAGLVLGIFGTVICALLMMVILSPEFQSFYWEFYESYYEDFYNQMYT